MAKKLLAYDVRARKALQAGADQVANAVRVTLGPRGRNVVIEKSWGAPTVTKDGVTVAKDIELPDPFEDLGCRLLREVSKKTNDAAGDGTTTATVLAQSILAEGLRSVSAGANPLLVKRGIDQAVRAVIEQLRAIAVPVSDKAAYRNVASIAGNDPAIGAVVAEALDEVGADGTVTIEAGKTGHTEIELVEGMQFDKGYLSPYMVTDEEALEAVLETPYLFFWEKKLSSAETLLPLLQKIHGTGRSLVIVAEDVEGQALATLVVNHMRGIVRCVAVKAPGYGDRRKAMMGDMAALTGGQFVTEDLGVSLENVGLEMLGQADKVVATHDTCTIIGGKGGSEAIAGRIQQIKNEIENTTSDYDREKLEERLARLAGGVAQIQVGAATEVELKERKMRFEDALNSTRAAIEEGIVVGGGVALARAAAALDSLKLADEDEQIGVRIVQRSLAGPLRQIAANGGQEASVVLNQVLANDDPHFGYNALTEAFEDLFAAGVVDPVKVVRLALENAASIAGMLLTTECIVIEKPESAKPMPGGPGGPGGGMDGMDMDY
ncbi:MAG: chaperonin GroEL [Armatimonadetes bacterium]|nr:chaperonin GroEL [Armatimonadota bacterium]